MIPLTTSFLSRGIVLFSDRVRNTFPLKAEKILHLTASCHGGKLNDSRFEKRMRGEGPIADSIARQIELARRRYELNHKLPPYNLNAFIRTHRGQLRLL